MTRGRILDFRSFYEGTWALVVQHESPAGAFIARYGEVLERENAIPPEKGAEVQAGQTIARVGRLNSGGSMLHFELYATTDYPWPSLSIAHRYKIRPDVCTTEDRTRIREAGWHWNYQRRLDLVDPTDVLLALRDENPIPVLTPVNSRPPIHVVFEEAEVVTPSDEYYRRRAIFEQNAMIRRGNEKFIHWLRGQNRVIYDSHRGYRDPNPAGADLRSLIPSGNACQYFIYESEMFERHGPDW